MGIAFLVALGVLGGSPAVVANDNRHPAGTLQGSTLSLDLRAANGEWRPEGNDGPALRVEAFGEVGGRLMSPAPLIRVLAGTQILATVRNDLETPLRVHGFCDRRTPSCAALEIPAGETRRAQFTATQAGTYYYWGTTTGMPLSFRGAADTQLSGALIVDSASTPPESDRIFVITEWTSLSREQLRAVADAEDPGATFLAMKPKSTSLINGLSWPDTERVTYVIGEPVRWRVINLSTQLHPMHLHGFYFDVDSLGNASSETAFADEQKPRVVTQLMGPGSTMRMTWTPERVGNWLFHCHRMTHVAPERRLGEVSSHREGHGAHDPSAGMSGMVVGVTVVGPPATDVPPGLSTYVPFGYGRTTRQLTLTLQPDPRNAPGPTLVLTRGEPVEITVSNRLAESTAIHWHGLELDSYYDGVHGWSGVGDRRTPLVEPNSTFVVRITPPRTGTFIYHTHLHDTRQLTSGLYGAIVVVEPGETFDPSTDHVMVIGRNGPDPDAPVVINGMTDAKLTWKAGVRHRVRLINITPDDVFTVSLESGDGPVTWSPLTKDGAPVPSSACAPKAAKQIIAVGETYDFAYDAPAGRQQLWASVRNVGGKWQVQARVVVR
jgi:FtsP/CotA-like multicopper oxidase with cupredoxin domain